MPESGGTVHSRPFHLFLRLGCLHSQTCFCQLYLQLAVYGLMKYNLNQWDMNAKIISRKNTFNALERFNKSRLQKQKKSHQSTCRPDKWKIWVINHEMHARTLCSCFSSQIPLHPQSTLHKQTWSHTDTFWMRLCKKEKRDINQDVHTQRKDLVCLLNYWQINAHFYVFMLK